MEMRQAMLAHTRGIQPEREHVELTSHEEVMFDYLVNCARQQSTEGW